MYLCIPVRELYIRMSPRHHFANLELGENYRSHSRGYNLMSNRPSAYVAYRTISAMDHAKTADVKKGLVCVYVRHSAGLSLLLPTLSQKQGYLQSRSFRTSGKKKSTPQTIASRLETCVIVVTRPLLTNPASTWIISSKAPVCTKRVRSPKSA